MASTGRRGLSQAKSALASKFDGRVTLPLADLLERVVKLQAQVEELTRIVATQVEVSNQTAELFGRLLATASQRLDLLEEPVGSDAAGRAPAKAVRQPRSQPTGSPPAGPHPV